MGVTSSTPQADGETIPSAQGELLYYPDKAGWTLFWIVFGLMAGSAVCFAALTFSKPLYDRTHGYLTTLIVLTAAIAYYTMASKGGDTLIRLYWNANCERDVFYARYVDWFITTPLLLADLLLIAAVPVATVLWIVVCDLFMIVLGVMGATSTHKFRWGYFAIGCVFQVLINWGIFVTGTRYAYRHSAAVGSLYLMLAVFLTVVWLGYPVCWALAEASSTIGLTAEIAFYGGLDIVAKVVFGWILMLSHPILSKQLQLERAEGKSRPSLLEAPFNAPLSSVFLEGNHGFERRGPHNLVGVRGADGTQMGSATTAEAAGPAHGAPVI